MALARQATGSGSFGRRGFDAPRAARAAPARKSTVSQRPEARTAEAARDAMEAIATDVGTAASRGKAYVKAILAAAMTFIAVLFVMAGVESRFFQSGPLLFLFAVPVLPTLGLILYIPTVILADLARLLSVPRGWSDIGIGTVLGVGLGVATAMTNPDDKALQTALAIAAGGIVGGFAFWRAQGYPGASSGAAAALDTAYKKMT